MNDLIGTSEAGRLLELPQGYIMRLARSGKIEARKLEGIWFLSRLSVLQYKEGQVKDSTPAPNPIVRETRSTNGHILTHPQKQFPLTRAQVEFLQLAKEVRRIATEIRQATEETRQSRVELCHATAELHQMGMRLEEMFTLAKVAKP